jgi:hypothetical protein
MKLFIIIIILYILYINYDDIEKFNFYNCRNCGNLNKKKCDLCLDCGWCINNSGDGMCVPGNKNGPYFKDDCVIWKPYLRYNRYKPRFYGRKFPKYMLYRDKYALW